MFLYMMWQLSVFPPKSDQDSYNMLFYNENIFFKSLQFDLGHQPEHI